MGGSLYSAFIRVLVLLYFESVDVRYGGKRSCGSVGGVIAIVVSVDTGDSWLKEVGEENFLVGDLIFWDSVRSPDPFEGGEAEECPPPFRNTITVQSVSRGRLRCLIPFLDSMTFLLLRRAC